MHADALKLLWDAQQAPERVARFTAVERQFEIIGEALNQLARIDPDTADVIPELPRIVAFRNILIHGYASVDNRLVWGVIEGNLGSLREALRGLLAES